MQKKIDDMDELYNFGPNEESFNQYTKEFAGDNAKEEKVGIRIYNIRTSISHHYPTQFMTRQKTNKITQL